MTAERRKQTRMNKLKRKAIDLLKSIIYTDLRNKAFKRLTLKTL